MSRYIPWKAQSAYGTPHPPIFIVSGDGLCSSSVQKPNGDHFSVRIDHGYPIFHPEAKPFQEKVGQTCHRWLVGLKLLAYDQPDWQAP